MTWLALTSHVWQNKPFFSDKGLLYLFKKKGLPKIIAINVTIACTSQWKEL